MLREVSYEKMTSDTFHIFSPSLVFYGLTSPACPLSYQLFFSPSAFHTLFLPHIHLCSVNSLWTWTLTRVCVRGYLRHLCGEDVGERRMGEQERPDDVIFFFLANSPTVTPECF